MELRDASVYVGDSLVGVGRMRIDEREMAFEGEPPAASGRSGPVAWRAPMERVLIHALYSVRGEEAEDGAEAFPMPCIYLQVETEEDEGADGADGGSDDDDRDSFAQYVDVKIVLREDREAFSRAPEPAADGKANAAPPAAASPQLEQLFAYITDCLMANEGENYAGAGAAFGFGDDDGGGGGDGSDGAKATMMTRFDEMLNVNGFDGGGGDARFEDAVEEGED